MDALEFLSGHAPLFSGIAENDLSPLAVDSTLRKVAAGQIVLYAGVTVEHLHVVAAGKVAVHAKVPGKGLVVVAELEAGEVFGEASILERSLAGATVKAADGGATILLVPEEPFRRLYGSVPELRERVDALVASRRAPTK